VETAKRGDLKKCWIPFMKLYRNIHRSVWQLLGVEKIQNGGRCHGNQGTNCHQIQKSSDLGEIWLPLDVDVVPIKFYQFLFGE
jgi:hypothetical protein